MSTEDNKAVIHRIVDGLNQKEVAVLDELYTPDFVSHDPANPQVRSREDFKQWFTGLSKAFPDLHFSLEDMLAEEDRVAYRFTLRDGKIAELWSNTDALGLVQQLGLIPTPGQAS
jgi:predicted ester cyclase